MALERFKEAQEKRSGGFATAIAELRAGQKTSHWIWYVFPQLAGLGHSSTARFYGLDGLPAACAYLRDSVLRERLLLATAAVHEQLAAGVPISRLMGGTVDSLKLVSSLTLFEHAAHSLRQNEADPALARLESLCADVLAIAARQGFPRCGFTLEQVGEKPPRR